VPPASPDVPGSARPDAPGRILVVDDMEANRQLLSDCVSVMGHECRMAGSAEEALQIIAAWMPDVILLDIMMPTINGLDLCRMLKADPAMMMVPIILVTAMNERATRIKGIDAGANDFLTKPVDTYEVVLRIRNALRSKRLYDDTRQAHQRLAELEQLRDSMTHMLVHDLRGPLQGIGMSLEMIVESAAKLELGDIRDDAGECMRTTQALTEMVSTILDVSRLEAASMPIELSGWPLRVIVDAGLAMVYQKGKTPITCELPEVTVTWDRHLMSRAIANLVGNALKYAPGDPIRIAGVIDGEEITVQVDDCGPGVPSAVAERLFTKFAAISGPQEQRHSTGLGLFFCKQVADVHGGTIGAMPREPQGSRFWMRLPITVVHQEQAVQDVPVP